ncbi:FecR family protein [Luteimonas saliphila]|uniref:FecR family protein n=1 Tax=Luteimonas saliphila TaxID=2804919 RepID=UPI00192E0AA8|nr:FecR domain-containing protein [Luteimonas saliphila]
MANNAEIERIAGEWLARRESGWDAAEQARFQSWLEASTAHRVAWIRLEAGWQRAARLKALAAGLPAGEVPPVGAWPELPGVEPPQGDAADPAADLHAFVFRAPVPRRERRWARRSATAALLLLSICMAGWWYVGGLEHAAYATALGETQRLRLSDGSVIVLSSDSRVELAYARRKRSLRLERGEVFFEVASDPDRPFSVEAEGRRVVAIGTQFSVRRDVGELRVAVTEGRVRLEDQATGDSPTLLIAGMVASAGSEGVRLRQSSPEQVEDMLRWREGMLVFRSTPLAEAVAEFNRYNAHKLLVDDPSIADIPVGGTFRWANAEAFVRVLEQGFGISAERGDAETRLHSR